MRTFRDTYNDRRTGKRRAAKSWTIEFRDHDERARRIVAFSDRRASEDLGRKLERLAELRSNRQEPDRELARAIEGWPERIRERLTSIGLLDARRSAAALALEKHLEAFERSLADRGNTEKHAGQAGSRARRVLLGSGARFWSEITPHAVERKLAALREDGLGLASSNYLLQAARQFCRWMVQNGLASEDPLRVLRPLNAKTDKRRERRALTAHELRALIQNTHNGPERAGMDGPTRALLYRLASETGLRRNELRSLRVLSFEGLETDAPAVRLLAGYSKRRREDELPLRVDTARALESFLRGRMPNAQPFPVPERAAVMLREDLEAVSAAMKREDPKSNGIPYEDESGRVVDFHALRHGFITALARGGVDPKTAQALARHSTITLTMDRYTHLRPGDERRALNQLPDLHIEVPNAMRATGTDATPLGVDCSASCSASEGVQGGASMYLEEHTTPSSALETVGEPGVEPGRACALRILSSMADSASEGPESASATPPAGISGVCGSDPANVLGVQLGVSVSADPALMALARVWPLLSEDTRGAVLRVAGIGA